MATPVLNNGIFLRDTSYKASSHVDSYHLTQMLGSDSDEEDAPDFSSSELEEKGIGGKFL
jgi:hypothetical protein